MVVVEGGGNHGQSLASPPNSCVNGYLNQYLATGALRFLAEVAGPDAVAEFARRQVADLERRYGPVVRGAAERDRVAALAEALSADGYAASASGAPCPTSTSKDLSTSKDSGTSTGAGASTPPGSSTGPGTDAGRGEQLCQHHCPVAHVAAEFPQLCEAETEAFARLLGTPVQRLATIAHGDGICTTHITAPTLLNTRSTP